MAIGLIVMDVLYLALSTLLYGVSGWVALQAERWAEPWLFLPLTVLLTALTFLLTLIASVAVGIRLCPALKPGRYTLMQGPVFFSWAVRTLFRRVLLYPPLRVLLFNVSALRFLALQALGAKVAFSANISNDVEILDPSLLTLEAGSICGAQVFLSGHFIKGNTLILGRIEVGKGALLGMGSAVAPDVSFGAKSLLLGRANVSMGVRIGPEARVGNSCLLDSGAEVGARAKVGNRVHVPPGVRIPEGSRYPAAPA